MNKKMIIIGGGVAGLSTGIYAQMNGYDTEILELHSLPGGQCTAWKRKGYTFDYCIHWLVGSASGPFYDIWKETGALGEETKIWDPDTFTTMRMPDGEDFIVYADIDQWEQYLGEMAPEDRKSIARMCNDMRRMTSMQMFEDPAFRRSPLDYLGFMIKSGPAVRMFMKYGKMSLTDYFDKLNFRNELLKEKLLTIGMGMEDFSAIAFLFTLLWYSQKNAGYPLGGSLPFSMRMADRYSSLGGSFTGKARVEKIIVNDKKATGVRLTDGTLKYADYVVGACDLHALMYDMLDGKYLTPKIEKAFKEWPLFEPIVQVSFGINRPIESKYHSYQVITSDEKIGSTTLKRGYSVSNYNHDPEITPEGKCVMKLLFETPIELWEDLDREAYLAEKAKIAQDAIAKLKGLYPDVNGSIEVVDVATPLTNIRYTGVYKAAYEGFLPSSKNMTKTLPNTIKGLENFYLAGQWLSPGGGLPPSAQSGKWLIQLLSKKDKKKFRVV